MNIFKKIGLTVVAVLVFVWCGVWLWRFFTYGILIVETDQTSQVFITQNVLEGETKQIGTGNIKVRVPAANYTVASRRESDGAESRYLITVQKRLESRVNLTLLKPIELREVGIINAKNIYYDSKKLLYVDPHQKLIYTYLDPETVPQNIHSELFPVHQVVWSEKGNALVEGLNGMSIIQNGVSSPLRYPPSLEPKGGYTPFVYDYSVSDTGRIAINFNGEIYTYSSLKSSPRLVKNVDESSLVEMANDGNLLVFTDTSSHPHEGGSHESFLINPSGNVISEGLLNEEALDAVWSPNNQNVLLIKNSGLSKLKIDSQENIDLVYGGLDSPQHVYWLNNRRILYVDDRALWVIDTETRITRKLTSLPTGEYILSSINFSGNEVLLSTLPYSTVEPGRLYKVNLTE